MSEEKYCYKHTNLETRLLCSSCGKPICLKCAVGASIGYRCPECGKRNLTHLDKISAKQYVYATLSGLFAGLITGLIWYLLRHYSIFINLAVAYAVGFCISKAIFKTIGSKIGLRIQVLTGIITIISMVYNPLIFLFAIGGSISFLPAFFLTIAPHSIGNIYNLLALVIAIWAAIRHFKI